MARYEDKKRTEEIELAKYIHLLKEAARIFARDNIQIDYGTLMAGMNTNKQTPKPYLKHAKRQERTDKTIRMYTFCYNCGDELPENAYYCIMCGRQIRN